MDRRDYKLHKVIAKKFPNLETQKFYHTVPNLCIHHATNKVDPVPFQNNFYFVVINIRIFKIFVLSITLFDSIGLMSEDR